MPRQRKVSFNQKLASYDVLIEDTSLDSEYFKVSQFPMGFSGGKNGFLLAGTPFLVPNSRVLVEVINVDNQTIYHESVKNYTEGTSKLISFEVYENTPPGLYKVILLGQARFFANGHAIPSDWSDKYNVRWSRDVIVEPQRRNISPIRFKKTPRIFIEQENIISIPSSSFVTQFDSSSNILLTPRYESTLTKGYTITLSGSTFTHNYFNGIVTGSVTASVGDKIYTTEINLPINKIINETRAESTGSLIVLDGVVDAFLLKSGSYAYTSSQTGTQYNVTSSIGIQYSYVLLNENITLDTGSYGKLRIVDLGTNTGEVYKTEISYKIPGTSAEYIAVSTPKVTVPELLVSSSEIGDEYWIGTFISGGLHNSHFTETHWYAQPMPAYIPVQTGSDYTVSLENVPSYYYSASDGYSLILDSSKIMNGVYPVVPITSSMGNTSIPPYVFGTKDSHTLFANSEYTLTFTALFTAYTGSTKLTNTTDAELYVYLASSETDAILDTNPLGQFITKLSVNQNAEQQYFEQVSVNFNPKVFDFGNVSLRFIATNGFWYFSNISIKPAEEFAFNPDETSILVPNYVDGQTISYKARFFDINGNSTKLEVESSPITFVGPRKYVKRAGDDMYGELYINEVPVRQQTLESSFTGLLSGGVITINPTNSASYDISAGYGYIVDNFTNPLEPTYQLVSWSKFEGITPGGLGTNPRTNIAISSSGQIHEQPDAFTDLDYRRYIVLGRLAHVGTPFIQRALSLPLTVYNRHFHWFDFVSALSPLNVTGNIYNPSGSSMNIIKTSGETYRIGSNYRNNPQFPDITTDTAITNTPVQFAYRWRSGSVFAEAPITTIVTGSLYDDGSGTLQPVQNNRFTVQRIYFFGATNTTRIQFGQHIYNSMAEAIAASNSEVFDIDPNLASDATFRAFMIVKGDASNLSDPLQATFIPVSQFGAGGGSGGGGVSSLAALTDVELTSPINKDVLTYDANISEWVNKPVFPYSGSVIISGSVTASAYTGSLSYNFLTNVPTLVSASSQINYTGLSNIPAGIVSSSAQVPALLPAGTISASSQVQHNSTTGYVANEHINHTSVLINAGNGLTGGGDISASRTLTLDTGSVHFTSGVKNKLNTDGVYSSSAQLVVSSYTNATDNRILTSTGAGGINGETNLTFDGSSLNINGTVNISGGASTNIFGDDSNDQHIFTGSVTIDGELSATTKSFLINHPVKQNHKLRYGSLESPYHGIRLTGEAQTINGQCVVMLPDYISELVTDKNISVQLTSYGHNKTMWVDTIDIKNNKFVVKVKQFPFMKKSYKFFWSFTAVRKDIPEMEVEFSINDNKS